MSLAYGVLIPLHLDLAFGKRRLIKLLVFLLVLPRFFFSSRWSFSISFSLSLYFLRME